MLRITCKACVVLIALSFCTAVLWRFAPGRAQAATPVTMPSPVPATLPAEDEPPSELLKPVPSPEPVVVGQYGLAAACIQFDAPAFDPGQPVKGHFILPETAPDGPVQLQVRVYDSLGRVLVEKTLPATQPVATNEKGEAGQNGAHPAIRAVPFEIVVPSVIAQRHYAEITARGAGESAPMSATADFYYRPATTWDDYICNIWQHPKLQKIAALQNLYLTGSQASGTAVGLPDELYDGNFRYYVEGTGNWVFSAYHHSYPDRRPNQYEYLVIKELFKKDRNNSQLLERDPCLSDHVIQNRIQVQFQQVAQQHQSHSPLFYSIADEAGIADQAAPFDFCFSNACKERFRAWLRDRYKTLDALNAEWASNYTDWQQVRGETTDELFARKDENFAAWCDFKDFMDSVQISAYQLAKNAVRRGDPRGRMGMGGAQGPNAVGAWDFWKLTRVMDVIEAYYIGNNYELMRSFAPNCILVHTAFPSAERIDPDRQRTWYTFMQGDRGLWVWDDDSSWVDANGQPSNLAKRMTPQYKELTGGLGMLRIASRRADDPIAIYESQANLRVHWVLEVKPEGENWINRTSATERKSNQFLRRRESWAKIIEDNGYQMRFIAPEQVNADLVPFDAATGKGVKVLVLPDMLALSAADAEAIRKFVQDGGTAWADGMPGAYDEHGRKLDKSPLADLFSPENGGVFGKGHAVLLSKDVLPYYQLRVIPTHDEEPLRDYIGGMLREAIGAAKVEPDVLGEDGKLPAGVETTVWQNGKAQLIGLIRNAEIHISELGSQEYHSNARFEQPVTLTVRSAEPRSWYDVRTGKPLGAGKEIKVTLQPFDPEFVMSYPAEAGAFSATVDASGRKINIEPSADCPLEKAIYHLDFIGPDGKERIIYRRNVSIHAGDNARGGSFELPLALNDEAGDWTLHIREVSTGKEVATPFAWRK